MIAVQALATQDRELKARVEELEPRLVSCAFATNAKALID